MINSKRNNFINTLFFIGPVFVIYTAFFAVPLVNGVVYSFSDWNGIDNQLSFVGFKNFTAMFTDDSYFTDSLNRTFFLAFVNVFFTNLIAMFFAIALTSRFRLNDIWRASLFLPNVISMVVSGFIWKFMFSQIAANVAEVTGIEAVAKPWLGDPSLVMFSIVIVSVWWGMGYIMTIYIAGIQGIDASIVEAGDIDGCNTWQSFWRIKLPSMLPVVTIGIFLNVSGSLKIFDIIFSLTGGGPGKASEVAMLNIYREAFVYGKFGYGTAKALVLTLIIIVITMIQLRLSRKVEA